MKLNLGSHDYVQTLKGQKLTFPDFDGLLRDFPTGMSPHYETLKGVINAELKMLLGPGPRYDALVACDCAFNACTWWPDATFDALRFNAHFVAFLYVWDNELDSPEFNSTLSTDPTAAARFRAATVAHVDAYLGDGPRPAGSLRAEDVHVAIASFNPVGEMGAFRLNRGQRRLFRDEIVRYIHAVGEEQRLELRREAPSIKEYLPVRMGTSAAAAIAAAIEYMVGIDLGDELRGDPDVAVMREATNCVVSLMNDVFSLRRELMFPFYNNAVAVLYHEHRQLRTAVDETYKLVAASVADMEAAFQRLVRRYPDRRGDLERFRHGARGMCSGNMEWSKRNRRYALNVARFDGTTEITI